MGIRTSSLEIQREYDRKYIKTEKARNRILIHNYNLSLEGYEAMLAAQGGVCAICKTFPDSKRKNLSVDHDHSCCPGQWITCGGTCIRGLVCFNCNIALGMMKDDPARLEAAAAYLKR